MCDKAVAGWIGVGATGDSSAKSRATVGAALVAARARAQLKMGTTGNHKGCPYEREPGVNG